jgi:hypothetical protein
VITLGELLEKQAAYRSRNVTSAERPQLPSLTTFLETLDGRIDMKQWVQVTLMLTVTVAAILFRVFYGVV